MNWLCAILAVLSIWEYPSRQRAHELLRRQFVEGAKAGDAVVMEAACRKGVALLPEDPTWHYNLACSLAHFEKRSDDAFDELEKAIDLGFKDVETIACDNDLKLLAQLPRHAEMLEYAKEAAGRRVLMGPMAAVEATGDFGRQVTLGAHNLGWNFGNGCFVALMRLSGGENIGNRGDLYMNRDAGHSAIGSAEFPGLTFVRLDAEGRKLGADLDAPNMEYPFPVFGNCSRAFMGNAMWRSLPRALMTRDPAALNRMSRFYLSNQVWVFPANEDIAPIGTNGDVFASITPYWLTTAGRSYSDLPYLRAALEVSRLLNVDIKREAVKRGLLAPVVQMLIRKSLKGVNSEEDYLSAKAHPTALPPNGVELARLKAASAALKEVPPVVPLLVKGLDGMVSQKVPELTYATPLAWAYVLRDPRAKREFEITAGGAEEYSFVKTHGDGVEVKIERHSEKSARIMIDREGMSPTNRVDIAVFGRKRGGVWGAPSYVSFALMDATAAYSDPALTIAPTRAEAK